MQTPFKLSHRIVKGIIRDYVWTEVYVRASSEKLLFTLCETQIYPASSVFNLVLRKSCFHSSPVLES